MIETRYFMGDARVVDGLRMGWVWGIEVKIMIGKKRDEGFVYWGRLWYMGDVVKGGGSVYI